MTHGHKNIKSKGPSAASYFMELPTVSFQNKHF